MRTDYLTASARHDRHRFERAVGALHRLLGFELAEQVMEGEVSVDALPADAVGTDDLVEVADASGGTADR